MGVKVYPAPKDQDNTGEETCRWRRKLPEFLIFIKLSPSAEKRKHS